LLKKLAPQLLNARKYSFEDFEKILNKIQQSYPEENWRIGSFSSSDAEAGRVAKAMYEAIGGDVNGLLNAAQ